MIATVQTEPRRATDARPEREYLSPGVNIFETSDGYVLEAEMPGVTKEGLEITLEGNEITIVGRRMDETAPGDPLFRERAVADYRRGFGLGPATAPRKTAPKKGPGGR